jgi:peptidoglycan hydrolase FlgJ
MDPIAFPLVPTTLPPRIAETPAGPTSAETAQDPARASAEAFEAVFLAEMLKHSGVNALPGGFGGGAGEEAFASFLTQEYARLLAARGGIGLADQIFEAIKARENGA